ncbi:hypothetical protein Bpfe_015061, partial [Biomphalaria pfeifferi]
SSNVLCQMEMTSEALKKSELHTGQVRVDDFGEPCLTDSEIPGTSVIGRMFGNMNSVIRDLLRPLNADFTSIGVDDFGEPVFIQDKVHNDSKTAPASENPRTNK